MDESLEGLALPHFSGRLSSDWSSHEQRLRAWLAMRGIPLHAHEAAHALSLSLEAQASLAFEHDAGGADRYTFETAASWCRDRWGGQTRQRWAIAAAVNALNARSFRERGRRREGVKDLVGDLDLLFLQAGVTEDESRMRVLIGTFFEFPHAVSRLSRSPTYNTAVSEALSWEADMIRKERGALAARVGAPSSFHLVPRPTTSPDDHFLDRPRPTTNLTSSPMFTDGPSPISPRRDEARQRESEPARPERGQHPDEHGDATSLGRPRPSRSTETLNISLRSVDRGTVRESSHEAPRAQSSLSHYSSGERGAPLRPSASPPHRPTVSPSFVATGYGGGATLAVPPQRPSFSTARSVTPPFVAEATSFRSSFTSAGDGDAEGGGRAALYEAFPYPARASPGTARVRAGGEDGEQRAPSWGVGEALWRAAAPVQGRSERHGLPSQPPGDERNEGRTLGKASRLARLFKRSLSGHGHGRGRSIGSAAELSRLDEEGRTAVQVGRPAKPRGKVVRDGLQLPP
ncbi:hypothetical protein JCM8208_003292 [Rhodotorula glutinis]